MGSKLDVVCDTCGEKLTLDLESYRKSGKTIVRIAVLHGEKPHILIVYVDLENSKVVGKEMTSYVLREQVALPKTSKVLENIDYRGIEGDLDLLVEVFISLLLGYSVKIEKSLIRNQNVFLETLKSSISIEYKEGEEFFELKNTALLDIEGLGEVVLSRKNKVNKDVEVDRKKIVNALKKIKNIYGIVEKLREINRVESTLRNIFGEVSFVMISVLKKIIATDEETLNIATQILENRYRDLHKKIIRYGLDLLI